MAGLIGYILILTTILGISTYIKFLHLAKIMLIHKNISETIKKVSPYDILDKYSLDRAFSNKIISILFRIVIFTTGFPGIILCVVIHDLYYNIVNKHELTVNNNEDEIVNKNIPKDNTVIDLLVDNELVEKGLNIKYITSSLEQSNITCARVSFVTKIDKEDTPVMEEVILNYFYYIKDLNIDEAMFKLNKEYPQKDLEQTVCICKNEDYNKSTFKHLCIPVDNKVNLDSRDYWDDISKKIIELLNNLGCSI